MFDFPDWYSGGPDDIEFLVKTILDKAFRDVSPKPTVKAWLNQGWRELMPLVCVARVPGAIDESPSMDTGVVQVYVICESRQDSWALAGFVEEVLRAFKSGAMVDVGTHKVDVRHIVRTRGPELSMDDDALHERIIPMSFEVKVRRRVSAGNFDNVLSYLE